MPERNSGVTPPQEIAVFVRTELAVLLECAEESVDLTQRITELPGIDSLKLVRVVAACEEHWDIELDEDELFEIQTAEDLCDLIELTRGRSRETV